MIAKASALSYAGLPAADIPVFESLIGKSFVLSAGTGYSPISVQAVPEPSTWLMGMSGLAGAACSMVRPRKKG